MEHSGLLRASALGLALGLALAAPAQLNLVQNGDFEAVPAPSGTTTFYAPGASLDGFWTVGGATGVGVDADNGSNLSGDNSLLLDPIGNAQAGPGSIAQTLATVAGQSYLVSFDVHNEGVCAFTLTFGGTALLSDAQLPVLSAADGFSPTDYVHRSFLVTATGASSVLFFSGSSTEYAPIELDNVSVVAQAVPEPAPFAILGVGVLGLLRRRRASPRGRAS